MFSPLLIITRVGMGLKGVHKSTRSIFSNYAAFSIPQLRTQLGQDALRVTVMTEQDRESVRFFSLPFHLRFSIHETDSTPFNSTLNPITTKPSQVPNITHILCLESFWTMFMDPEEDGQRM